MGGVITAQVPDMRSTVEIYADKNADMASRMATVYVQGRQDGGEGEHDSSVAFAFADAYKARRRVYDTKAAACPMPSLRDAYEEWRATGVIT